MGRRNENRVVVRLSIRIWGMDQNGKPFSQTAHTVDVTRLGARISGIDCIGKKGEIIGIQCGRDKARFKVMWIGQPGIEPGQIGVCCIEPEKYIWGVPLPKAQLVHEDAFKPKMEMLPISQQMQEMSQLQQQKPRLGDRLPADISTGLALPKTERKNRVHQRYSCPGSAEVLPEGARLPVWGQLSDISVSGCYIETTTPLSRHIRTQITLKAGGQVILAKATVRTSHPAVGMGLSFTHMSMVDRDRLENLIRSLHESSAETDLVSQAQAVGSGPLPPQSMSTQTPTSPIMMPPHPVAVPDPPSQAPEPVSALQAMSHGGYAPQPPMPTPTTPIPAAMPPAPTPTATPAFMPPTPTPTTPIPAAAAAAGQQGGIDARVSRLSIELRELHLALASSDVDARLLRAFREAVEYAHQTAVSVQQWLHLRAQKRDPFDVLPEHNVDRIAAAIEMNKNLTIDIDALEISLDTKGLDELHRVSDDLARRLAKILKKS